jgi:hypothetical protein
MLQPQSVPRINQHVEFENKLKLKPRRALSTNVGTMSQKVALEAWRNITGIGHGGAWCNPSTASSDGRNSSTSLSPWSEKACPLSITAVEAVNPSSGASSNVLNAAAPVFSPGGQQHCAVGV